MMFRFFILVIICCCFGCQQVEVPKPKAFLRLEYPNADYKNIETVLPFTFKKNKLSTIETVEKNKQPVGLNLNYNALNATVYLTYGAVDNNLNKFISDAGSITQKHAQMAREVSERSFENEQTKVYGKLYELRGPVASQIQFHISDHKKHFLTGALYFNTRPNYDSILPAVDYVKKDIVKLMESLRWKN
jgi:gliding motility-associated lipoprotein GldD